MVDSAFAPAVIPLWPDGAPGSENWSQQEQETYLPVPSAVPQTYLPLPFDVKVVRNIARPTLTAHLPDPSVATGTAVVVCPGGVFHYLSIEFEGAAVARWLCARGVAAFVLKYRVLWLREQVCHSIPRGEMPVTRSNCTSMLRVVMDSG